MEKTTLKGLTLNYIYIMDVDRSIYFETECGKLFHMKHKQIHGEHVFIEGVTRQNNHEECSKPQRGKLSRLIGSPIISFEKETIDNPMEHITWTIYKLATSKEVITIRWKGYSQNNPKDVTLEEVPPHDIA